MTKEQFIHNFRTNSEALKNFALKLTKSSSQADDLVQITGMKAFKSLHTFKDGTNFKSWAYTILKNSFINQYHKRKKRGVVNAPIEDFTFALENKYSVRNSVLSKLRLQDIKACVENLSHKSKVPFKMHLEGYQYNEISQELDIPMGTVKSRINFARKKLKSALISKGLAA